MLLGMLYYHCRMLAVDSISLFCSALPTDSELFVNCVALGYCRFIAFIMCLAENLIMRGVCAVNLKMDQLVV